MPRRSDLTPSPAPRAIACAAALLAIVSIAVFWPGVAMYDTVTQYEQVVSGAYTDWHPPAMARLWSLLHPLGPSAVPMLVVQLLFYWLGLALIATALTRMGRRRAAWAIIAIGPLPIFLGWQGVVLKDAQLVGAAMAGVGLLSFWRLRGRRTPLAAIIAAAALLFFAMLVRANGVFALAPLAAFLLPIRKTIAKAIAAVVIAAAVLAASGPINHRLLGAEPTGVARTQPLFDLAGIAVRVENAAPTGLTPQEIAALRAQHCVTPYFWDPLGEPTRCEPIIARLAAWSIPDLYLHLATAVLRHPLAYAAQRLSHANMTMRWIVPAALPGAAPPSASEPNTLGLGNPGRVASWWQALAGVLVETPLGWPIAYIALAAALCGPAWRANDTAAITLARALLVSALALEGSFLALSIASDLRYHLWPMLATTLAAVLLGRRAFVTRRETVALVAPMLVVVAVGTVARLTLARPPQTYQALLSWQAPALP